MLLHEGLINLETAGLINQASTNELNLCMEKWDLNPFSEMSNDETRPLFYTLSRA